MVRPSSVMRNYFLGGVVVAVATTDKGNLYGNAQSCGPYSATAFVRMWRRVEARVLMSRNGADVQWRH